MQPPDLLSAHDVAIRLSLSVDTVLQLARQGDLPTQMMNGAVWFRPDDVAAYADRHPDADPPADGQVTNLIRPGDDAPPVR